MTQFGKRNVAGGGGAAIRTGAAQADLAAALAVVKTGKLPFWTKTGPVRLVFIMLGAPAVFWFLFLPFANDIVRDHRFAGTWQAAYDLQAFDAKCTRYNFVGTICHAKIKSIAEPDQAPIAVDFMMMFTGGGGEVLAPVRSTADPAAVTIAYAAETELMNRTLTLIAIAILLAAAFIASLRALLQGRYHGGAAHRALLAGFAELKARVEDRAGDPRAA